MEAPPPSLSAASTAVVYPESIDSSPRSRLTDSWDADPPLPLQKFRLMCSYGGHIVLRPHDKALSYIGGVTRIVVIDRHMSFSDLHHRLSKTLLNSQPFSLKYQLPNEDLDSLISITADEDLDNMVEEYDRLNNNDNLNAGGGLKTGRIRLFLFPKTSSNIEQFLVETASTKSDDWFFNALNGSGSTTLSTAVVDRGFSESSSVNCLLGLDDDLIGKAAVAGKEVDALIEGSKNGGSGNLNAIAKAVVNQDVHSVPDSPMLQTMSSFGSIPSSPSMASLPPIKVRVEENNLNSRGLEIEDHFQQMSVGITGNANLAMTQKHEEIGGFETASMASGTGVPVVVGGEFANRVISDDERSDHGGLKKVQQVQPQGQQVQNIPQFQTKQTGASDLASPDSASSEGSASNSLFRQRQAAMYQESVFQQMQTGNTRVTPNPSDPNNGDQNNKVEMQQQVQESSYLLSGQYDQSHLQFQQPQQFIHAPYNIPAGAMQVPSYYSVYPPQPQHNPQQPMLEQQYPFYLVQARPTQAYNIPMQQSSYSELVSTAPSHTQQHHPVLAPHSAFNQTMNAASRPVTGAPPPQLIQIPPSQHQAPYVGFVQIHRPSQSMAPPSSATNYTCGYEFSDPTHAQMYYAPQFAPQLASLYQTPTSTPAVVTSDVSARLSVDNIKHQQVRSLQQ